MPERAAQMRFSTPKPRMAVEDLERRTIEFRYASMKMTIEAHTTQ
jgi:hypothetical protein